MDAPGHGRQAGHQGERFQVVAPELAGAAEAAQLDHRQHETQAVALGRRHDPLVELEAGPVLRRRRRDQPAVVADGNENADVRPWSRCRFEGVPVGGHLAARMSLVLVVSRRQFRLSAAPRRFENGY